MNNNIISIYNLLFDSAKIELLKKEPYLKILHTEKEINKAIEKACFDYFEELKYKDYLQIKNFEGAKIKWDFSIM